MIEDRLGLTKEYVNPIFCFCVELLSNSAIDVEKAIEQMQPNINVQVLGMIVFLLNQGYTLEYIKQRFIDTSV